MNCHSKNTLKKRHCKKKMAPDQRTKRLNVYPSQPASTLTRGAKKLTVFLLSSLAISMLSTSISSKIPFFIESNASSASSSSQSTTPALIAGQRRLQGSEVDATDAETTGTITSLPEMPVTDTSDADGVLSWKENEGFFDDGGSSPTSGVEAISEDDSTEVVVDSDNASETEVMSTPSLPASDEFPEDMNDLRDPRIGRCDEQELRAVHEYFDSNWNACPAYRCLETETERFIQDLKNIYPNDYTDDEAKQIAGMFAACSCRCDLMKCEIDFFEERGSETCRRATREYCFDSNEKFVSRCVSAAKKLPSLYDLNEDPKSFRKPCSICTAPSREQFISETRKALDHPNNAASTLQTSEAVTLDLEPSVVASGFNRECQPALYVLSVLAIVMALAST